MGQIMGRWTKTRAAGKAVRIQPHLQMQRWKRGRLTTGRMTGSCGSPSTTWPYGQTDCPNGTGLSKTSLALGTPRRATGSALMDICGHSLAPRSRPICARRSSWRMTDVRLESKRNHGVAANGGRRNPEQGHPWSKLYPVVCLCSIHSWGQRHSNHSRLITPQGQKVVSRHFHGMNCWKGRGELSC